MLKLMKISVD